MAATPWRSVGTAAAGPSAETVSSTPSHKINSVLMVPTIAEKCTVFQAYLRGVDHARPTKCLRNRCADCKVGFPSPAHSPLDDLPSRPSECIALRSENP